MPININTVYQKVLDIANKEQRGYITPNEFNSFADQAQMEIFDSYFYSSEAYGRTRPNDTEHSDRHDIIQEKIEYFEKEIYGAEIAFQPDNFRRYQMFTPTDFYKLQTVLVAESDTNEFSVDEFLIGEDTGVDGGVASQGLENEYERSEPDKDPENQKNIFGPKAFAVNEAEYVSKKELINIMGNKLTRPTMRRPVYTFEGKKNDFIRVFGKDNYPNNYNTQQRYFLDPSVFQPGDGSEFDTPPGHGRSPRFRGFDHNGILDHANVAPELLIISYIRKPATPRWGYVENNLGNTSYPIYNQGTSIDFEIHASEGSTLVNKILELSGVKLKQADISQVGRAKAQEKQQIRNR
tara:strand:+ start:1024 stop:2076 length:1053 start_codon:yes stop_codon:yes gene_type:complete